MPSALTYLSQVRRLRALAEEALKRFPVRAEKIDFINHGENTTFCVTAKGGRKFLLRIHRQGYHTPAAIQEELEWLWHIHQVSDLAVPSPQKSKSGKFLEEVSIPGLPGSRHCDLFAWVEGKFIFKSTTPKHMRLLGGMMAELHRTSRGLKVKHRNYWDAEGLIGKSARFGGIDDLTDASARDQKIISASRKEIFSYLKKFEKKFPERQGLIHADLHFGNFLLRGERAGAIDFDDSGRGFHAYDLAVPLTHLAYLCEKNPQKKLVHFVDALQEGYAAKGRWDQHDADALPYFYAARRILMLGWMQLRSDLPDVKKRLKGAVKRNADFLRTEWRKF